MVLARVQETAAHYSSVLQSSLDKSTAIVSEKLNLPEHYTFVSDQYKKLTEYCPSTISDGLTSTRSAINNGTKLIYSIPSQVGDKVYSYTSVLQPVNDAEEVTRAHPHDRLAEGVFPLKEDRIELVNFILDLYSSDLLKLSNESFSKLYDEEVVYEDQFMHTIGLAKLKSHFYGSAKLLKYTTLDYKILENSSTTLKINLTQKYILPYVGRYFARNVIVVLDFNEESKKVVKHTHLFWGKQPNPLVILRKGAGTIYTTLVKSPEI